MNAFYAALTDAYARPLPFQFYTTDKLWTDEHRSKGMLEYHLSQDTDLASRKTVTIERSCNWMIQRFCLGAGSHVLDLGCGPGLYANRLAATGAAVTGVDFSARSIAYAREQARRLNLCTEYECADYLRWEGPECSYDLAMIIFCDFCAISAERRALLLSKIRRMLKSGGNLLMDVSTTRMYAARGEGSTWTFNPDGGFWSNRPHHILQTTWKYEAENILLDHFHVVEDVGSFDSFNWLQCYDCDSIAKELDHAGFRILEYLSNVSGDAFTPGIHEMALVAHRD